MRRTVSKLAVAMAAMLAATSASAAPLALWMGQTEMVGLQRKIAKITVSDPEVLSVNKLKAGAELRALSPGKCHVEMKTKDGYFFEFDVHVTPRGAEVYSVNRAEGEHDGFTLEGSKSNREPKVVAKPPSEKEQFRKAIQQALSQR